MKNINIKLVASQALFVAGLIVMAIGGRWAFFTGLALVVVAGRFARPRDVQPRSFVVRIIWVLFCVGFIALLMWISSFGAEKPPLTALFGAWLAFSIDEYYSWQKIRRLTCRQTTQ